MQPSKLKGHRIDSIKFPFKQYKLYVSYIHLSYNGCYNVSQQNSYKHKIPLAHQLELQYPKTP